jgi:glycosyltransferase involved in cell wall biosynthesis
MTVKKKKKALSPERVREIAWEIGQTFPVPLTTDYVALSMVHPGQGHLQWHVRERAVSALSRKHGEALANASLVVRIYDVTDLIFDGKNAHLWFDIETGRLAGKYYFSNHRTARNYIAEIGLRGRDGLFYPLARSGPEYFDRDRPSGNYHTAGLFVGGTLNRTFPVENIFDAPVYERMNRELAGIKREEALSIAVVLVDVHDADTENPLASFILNCSAGFKKYGGHATVCTQKAGRIGPSDSKNALKSVQTASRKLADRLLTLHEKSPFHIIHCHDWYSSKAGLTAATKLKLPLVLSLHSTEYERTQGGEMERLSARICEWERKAVEEAHLVIVPHSSTRQQVINLYGASSEKVVIIPDVLSGTASKADGEPSGARQVLGLPPEAPVVLFAGEMSHAAGADLMMEAMMTVCRNNHSAHFVFAGEGPLKGELEARAHHSGIGHRCRFIGHVARKAFESLLMASDFVVIPARTWQDEGLAQMAIEFGRPVLTTQQAGINCVVHGKTGLVTFDNPGSITWGLQEMLNNPMKNSMLRIAARKSADEAPTLENVSAQHYMHYELVMKNAAGGRNA